MLDKIIIWPMIAEELAYIDNNLKQLSQITGRANFTICPIVVDDWNTRLSPWEYNDSKKIFAGGAKDFLKEVMEIRNKMAAEYPQAKFVLGGYSLAGLFSLWCAYETDAFEIIVSGSGSLWFPNFVEKYCEYEIQAKAIYMSLGNKEKRCRDKTMARIEDKTVMLFDSIQCENKKFVIEKGNHFTECRERMLRGFAWALNCGEGR